MLRDRNCFSFYLYEASFYCNRNGNLNRHGRHQVHSAYIRSLCYEIDNFQLYIYCDSYSYCDYRIRYDGCLGENDGENVRIPSIAASNFSFQLNKSCGKALYEEREIELHGIHTAVPLRKTNISSKS